jgi:hypothetical protein
LKTLLAKPGLAGGNSAKPALVDSMSISMRDGTPIAVPRWKNEAVESSIFHATIGYVALGSI